MYSQDSSIIKFLNITIMKKEENKKQEEQVLEEENLDNVAGGSRPRSMPREYI